MAKRLSDKEFIKKEKSYLQKLSQNSIKESLCKKCGGVIVRSYITSLMAVSYGKRCECWKMKKKKTDYIDKIKDIGTGKLSKKEERETERLSKEQGWKEGKRLKKR